MSPSSPGDRSSGRGPLAPWLAWMDLTTVATIVALVLSALSFYRGYIYVNQRLDVTVTEVSYTTNRGELYMTVAFSNGGNRDAAVLRVEPAYWAKGGDASGQKWVPLTDTVDPDIPLAAPKTPMIVKSGGVEVVTLSTRLSADDAERAWVPAQGGAFVGIRVATMNADGNLYLLEHPVAQLVIDAKGRIQKAEATIHRTLAGFSDLQAYPPGDTLSTNKQTPFVWADEHYRAD